MSVWIDLNEYHPKDGENILIYTNKNEIGFGYFMIDDLEIVGMKFNGVITSLSMWVLRGVVATHWMPPPESPK